MDDGTEDKLGDFDGIELGALLILGLVLGWFDGRAEMEGWIDG